MGKRSISAWTQKTIKGDVCHIEMAQDYMTDKNKICKTCRWSFLCHEDEQNIADSQGCQEYELDLITDDEHVEAFNKRRKEEFLQDWDEYYNEYN